MATSRAGYEFGEIYGWTDPGGGQRLQPRWLGRQAGALAFLPGPDSGEPLMQYFSGYYTVVMSTFKVYAGPRGCQKGISCRDGLQEHALGQVTSVSALYMFGKSTRLWIRSCEPYGIYLV